MRPAHSDSWRTASPQTGGRPSGSGSGSTSLSDFAHRRTGAPAHRRTAAPPHRNHLADQGFGWSVPGEVLQPWAYRRLPIILLSLSSVNLKADGPYRCWVHGSMPRRSGPRACRPGWRPMPDLSSGPSPCGRPRRLPVSWWPRCRRWPRPWPVRDCRRSRPVSRSSGSVRGSCRTSRPPCTVPWSSTEVWKTCVRLRCRAPTWPWWRPGCGRRCSTSPAQRRTRALTPYRWWPSPSLLRGRWRACGVPGGSSGTRSTSCSTSAPRSPWPTRPAFYGTATAMPLCHGWQMRRCTYGASRRP